MEKNCKKYLCVWNEEF